MQAAPSALDESRALQADHGTELASLKVAALEFANSLRAIDGLYEMPELITGSMLDCARCPVANTANLGVRSSYPRWEVGAVAVKISATGKPTRGKNQVPVPAQVADFMAAFDTGAYPELEATR